MTDIHLPDPDYPRPLRAEGGKPYYWRPVGYPVDQFLDQVNDWDLLAHMGVPTRFRSHVIDMYTEPFPPEVESWVASMRYIFRPPPSLQKTKPDLCGMGLVLWGESGTRKTTTAAAILLRLVRMRVPNLDPNPLPLQGGTYAGSCMGRFVSWQDAAETLREGVTESTDDGGASEALLLRRSMRCEDPLLRAADFLVLDDISRERTTEWNLGEIHRIMRYRHDNARPVIVTTNTDPQDWVRRYDEVFAAFLDRAFFKAEFTPVAL